MTQCPLHAYEDDPWPCPLTCEYFAEELDRRIGEVQEGTYFSILPRDGVKPRQVQEYRNGEPYGTPRPL